MTLKSRFSEAMSSTYTMQDPFAPIRAALHTGDFAHDFRSWIVAGTAFFLAIVGSVLVIINIRAGEYPVAATTGILPILMIFCVWLLSNRQAVDAAANVLVAALFLAIALPVVLSGGTAPGGYVATAIVVVVACLTAKPRVALASSIACVLLVLVGSWLTTTSWHFPIVVESDKTMTLVRRLAVTNCIVISMVLTLFRRSSERTRNELIEAQTDAQDAGEMLSSILVEHLSSIHLLARLQVIGRLGGWWFCPETRMVHHTVETAGVLSEFHLDELGSDRAIAGMSRPELRTLIAEVLATRQPWDKETKVIDASGNTRWYRNIGEIEFEAEEISRIYGVQHDITEIREVQAQQANGQKLEAIGTLAAGMAHEINTPAQFVGDNLKFLKDAFGDILTLEKAYAKLVDAAQSGVVEQTVLEETKAAIQAADPEFLSEEVPAALEQSIDGISRISHIVRAMKEFAHPSGQAWELADINKVVNDMITVAANEWKYSADIETDLDENMPPVPCAPQDIAQVVLNLIVNAAHAIAETLSESASEKGVIRISTKLVDRVAELRIADNGCGIPEELCERVFEPFFTTKDVGKGTGQGLAMAHKAIVGKHRGDLRLESTPGQGTTFIIRLPLDPPAVNKESGELADTT